MSWLNRTLIVGPYLFLATSEKEYREAVKALDVKKGEAPPWITPGGDATTHCFSTKFKKQACVVCVNPNLECNSIQIASLIVHEAVHVWQNFKESIGEMNPSPEFEAYSIQSISQELMTEYSKRLKKSGIETA